MKALSSDITLLDASHQEHNTLQEVVGTLIDSRWLIAGFVFLLGLAGVAHIWLAQPVYRAEALLKVDQQASGIGALEDFSSFSMFYTAAAALESEIELIKSRGVLGRVVDKLNLDILERPLHLPVVGDAIARQLSGEDRVAQPLINLDAYPWAQDYVNLKPYAWGGEHIEVAELQVPEGWEGEVLRLVALENGAYRLHDKTGAPLMRGTVGQLEIVKVNGDETLKLQISELKARPGTHFELTKIARLTAIKNLEQQLNVMAVGDELAASGLVKVSLEGPDAEHIAMIVNEVLRAYIERSNEWQSAEVERTSRLLKDQLGVVEAKTGEASEALVEFSKVHSSVDIPLETQAISEKIAGIEIELAKLTKDRERLLGRFTPLFTARADHVAALGDRIAALQKQKKALEEQMADLPATKQQLLRMNRDVSVNRNLVTLLKTRLQELAVVNAGTHGNARIVDEAEAADVPIKPEQNMLMTLYVLLGVVSGVAATFVRRMLRGAVEDPDLIEKQLGLPVYAIVPHSGRREKTIKYSQRASKKPRMGMLAALDPSDPAVESVRSLRTTLTFALLGAKTNTLLITGPAPGVGKSFVSANLSLVLANAGKRTVIIDADMRNGYLHEYFGIKAAPGLSNLIADDASVDQVIHATAAERLFIVPAGARPPNPSELLLNERFAISLQAIASRFDYVIIDSPPILPVTDAAIVGRLAGATLLVVKADTHTMREIERSVIRLKQAGVNLVGAVFNGISASKRYGYGKYYGYAYSYKTR
jgi:tyrosine-protein kinase Etk/Wzc